MIKGELCSGADNSNSNSNPDTSMKLAKNILM